MKSGTLTDLKALEIVTRIAAGDRTAETLFVQKYWKSLQFVLSQQSIDSELIADICQDTLIGVILKLRNNALENPAALSSYIRSYAINLVIESKRKITRQKTDCIENMETVFGDLRAEPERHISHIALIDLLQKMVNELPTQRDRDILRYTYFEHREKKHVCDLLDVSSEHFDKVLYRAKSRLNALLVTQHNIDISKHSLSKFVVKSLLVALVFYSKSIEIYDVNPLKIQINDITVREFSSLVHLHIIEDAQRRILQVSSKNESRGELA